MKTQATLFDTGNDDTNTRKVKRLEQRRKSTSQTAYEKLAEQMPELRAKVYRYLLAKGDEGATDEEMQIELGMNPSTQRPRRGELVAAGLVVDSGRRRELRSGNKGTVWVAIGERM